MMTAPSSDPVFGSTTGFMNLGAILPKGGGVMAGRN
jgi:hypothetical protein